MIPMKLSRILVPIDFSETSGAALDYAAFLAKAFGASVELVHVLDSVLQVAGDSVFAADRPPESLAEHGRRIALEELDRYRERLERQGIAGRTAIEAGVPWECIVRAAARADLVVMGTHGRTGLTRVLLGSVTDKVVQRSPAPVLTIRGAAPETVTVAAPARATGVT
jgi:universal stress protein A